MLDTKGGKRGEVPARMSWQKARLALVAAWEAADGCLGTLQVLFIHHSKAESSRRLGKAKADAALTRLEPADPSYSASN